MKSNKRAFVFILLNTSIHLWRNSSHWKGERKQKPKAPENIFSAISGTEVPRPWGVFLIPKRRHLLFPNFSGSHFGFAGLWPCAISRPGLACTLSSRRDGPWPSLSRPERRAGGRGGGRHRGRGSASAGSVPHQVPGEKRQGLYTDGRCGACDPASPRTARARKHLYVKAAVTDEWYLYDNAYLWGGLRTFGYYYYL